MASSKVRGPYQAVETRDIKKLRQASISLSIDDLVSGDMKDFDERMIEQKHSTIQIQICKEVRKRVKNRRAASDYKSRRRNALEDLREKNKATEKRLLELKKQQSDIIIEKKIMGFALFDTVDHVLEELGYNPRHYTLVWRKDGSKWKQAVEPLEAKVGEPETSMRKNFFPPNM